jgi:hypothetical protein
MAVSLKASQQGLTIVDIARKKKGWTKRAAAWCQAATVGEAGFKRFWQRKPIEQEHFIRICKAVEIDDWEKIVDGSQIQSAASYIEFSAYDDDWVGKGREELIVKLSDRVRGDCRVLILVGITGIGKTALAERLVEELRGDWTEHRENFEDENKASDFASIARRWLEEWGEKVPPEESKPEQLLQRLVKRLRSHQYLVLMDSLEELLTGSKETAWGDFIDNWWGKFFMSLLAESSCQSRLILTSQDFPVKLKQECSRYKKLWHHQLLQGLDIPEQVALFQKAGLKDDLESRHSPLRQIGEVYDGHPLALRVIVGEIAESFARIVKAYWKKYGHEIEEVKNALEQARSEGKVKGKEALWHLDSYTYELQNQVKVRIDKTFVRLEKDVKDAYFLLCTASVYRGEVPESFWLSHLEYRGYDKQRCEDALQALRDRYLVEDRGIDHEDERLVGQHNLIRSVAINHRLKLFPEN